MNSVSRQKIGEIKAELLTLADKLESLSKGEPNP